MRQHDKVLKLYADNGLRTVADWNSMGRAVKDGAKPITDTTHRGQKVAFYTRAQTAVRPKAVAAAATPAALTGDAGTPATPATPADVPR